MLQRVFVDSLIENDEKVASFTGHIQLKKKKKKTYSIYFQDGQNR